MCTQDSNQLLPLPPTALPHKSQTCKPHNHVSQFLKLDQLFLVCLSVCRSLSLWCVSLSTHTLLAVCLWVTLKNTYILKQAQRGVCVCPCGYVIVYLFMCVCVHVYVSVHLFTLVGVSTHLCVEARSQVSFLYAVHLFILR